MLENALELLLLVFVIFSAGVRVDKGQWQGTLAATYQSRQDFNTIDYRIWRVFHQIDPKRPAIAIVSVNPRHFNGKDMLTLALLLNKEFAGERNLRAGLVDDAAVARRFVTGLAEFQELEKVERGRYYLDRLTCREYIEFATQAKRSKRNTIRIKCSKTTDR